jgi:cytochrome b561
MSRSSGMNRYTHTAIGLHWAMALLIFAAFPVGLLMVDLPLSPTKLKIYSYHKWVGVTIFLLALTRLLWRVTHAAPAMPDSVPRWQQALAGATHMLLYLLIVAIPVSGWLMSSALGFQTVYLGVLPLPDLLEKDKVLGEQLRFVHMFLNYTLAALVLVHVGAALKHHMIDGDEILTRMLPLLRRRKGN